MNHDIWTQKNYIQAYRFAANAHRDQVVPGTNNLPYIMHLSFVSMEVIAALRAETGRDENLAVQSALLHDVIEDTNVSYQQVSNEFGSKVANGVLALSKDKRVDKQSQMEDSLKRIKLQPQEIWMVKLADRITNLQPPPENWTKDKIEKYQAEAIQIVSALEEASDFLASRLREKIVAYNEFRK